MKIKCPSCSYVPDGSADWNCQACGAEFDMFEKAGACTQCGFQHTKTSCILWRDGCNTISEHLDWYSGIDQKLEELGITKD
jgi:DNA-directed RNA polymerase subunit RPC12/RpoP